MDSCDNRSSFGDGQGLKKQMSLWFRINIFSAFPSFKNVTTITLIVGFCTMDFFMPIFGGTEAEMELDLKANKLIEEIVAVIRSNLDKEKLVDRKSVV